MLWGYRGGKEGNMEGGLRTPRFWIDQGRMCMHFNTILGITDQKEVAKTLCKEWITLGFKSFISKWGTVACVSLWLWANAPQIQTHLGGLVGWLFQEISGKYRISGNRCTQCWEATSPTSFCLQPVTPGVHILVPRESTLIWDMEIRTGMTTEDSLSQTSAKYRIPSVTSRQGSLAQKTLVVLIVQWLLIPSQQPPEPCLGSLDLETQIEETWSHNGEESIQGAAASGPEHMHR